MSDSSTPAEIPTRSVKLCDVADLEPGSAKRIDIEGHRLAVVRVADEWYVIDDECSHADYSLAEGDVDEDELTLECWKHGSQFSLRTGEPETMPAVRAVATYVVDVTESVVNVRLPKIEEDE